MFHKLHQEGLSISAIARHSGLDWKMVRKYLDWGQLRNANSPSLEK